MDWTFNKPKIAGVQTGSQSHDLTVNSSCYGRSYGRCYVKKTYTTVYFPQFHNYLEVDSARSFQNVFNKCSRVLNLVFSENGIFHEHRHLRDFCLFSGWKIFCKRKRTKQKRNSCSGLANIQWKMIIRS